MPEALFADFAPATYAQWVEAVRESLRGKPVESLVKSTYEGIDIHPLPQPDNLATITHRRALPGQFPFLRGASASGYRARPWLIAQDLDLSEPEAFNEALKDALANGQSAIMLGETLRLNEPADMQRALEGIGLRQYPVFIRSTARLAGVYDLLQTVFTNAETLELRGCASIDPLADLARTGVMPADAFDQLAAHVRRVGEKSPQLGSVAVDTGAYHDAGASAVQELALAIATGVSYMRELRKRGFSADAVAGKMQVFLNIGENFFIEVAKFRAVKLLWAQVLRAFGIDEGAGRIGLHARSGNRNKARRDPHVNLLRLTTEALSAAIGGVDSIQLTPFDQPLGKSNELSRRLGRNLQLILQEELRLVELIDPAGGAWHVEKLTDQLARRAWAQFQEIERRGGLLACLEAGYPQAEIAAVAEQRKRDMAAGAAVLVGSNRYANPDESRPPPRKQASATCEPARGGGKITAKPLEPLRLAEPFEARQQLSENGS